jgi:hypothetical protein
MIAHDISEILSHLNLDSDDLSMPILRALCDFDVSSRYLAEKVSAQSPNCNSPISKLAMISAAVGRARKGK